MSASLLGYDTRSLRSALVMRAVDTLNPFKRAQDFAWASPCVVSSIAGLGDLFIHLPLIAGIVNEACVRGVEIRVALRPAHVGIGAQCGWEILPFDNALEDFFKNPGALQPNELFGRARGPRKNPPALWIDLTGNAVSALAVKLAGAKKLAARVTRGGASLIDYSLPHSIQENEYDNRARVAAVLGCELDFSLAEKLRGEPIADCENTVVLCLTTITRWRNWPLENFRRLAERFPRTNFVATGFRNEIAGEELDDLAKLLRLPNVSDQLDQLSIVELIRLIAHAPAVVTNDTSAAHIANFFGTRGAVLFGPAGPATFAMRGGLQPFHDATCPFFPCVQWKCSNETNWCMRKISARAVGDYLETLPGLAS
jgi:ADP-heptose:LPS heptosyltransferase